MLILSKNALNLGGSVVASSADYYFPASNMLSFLASDVWRSGKTLGTETLTFTLDRNYNNETLFLVLHGFDFTNVTGLTYQLGALPAVAIAGWTNGQAFVTKIPVPASNYNGVVLTFTKSASNLSIQVGKVYIGNGFDNAPLDDPQRGMKRIFFSMTNQDYSVAGQKFAEGLYQSWRADLTLPLVPEQQMQDTIRNFITRMGSWNPFFIQIDNYGVYANSSPDLTQVRYVTFSGSVSTTWADFGDVGFLWSLSYSLEEQL